MSTQQQQPQEEGPRSFSFLFGKVADGDAEREASAELHELLKRLQEHAHMTEDAAAGSLTLKLSVAVTSKNVATIKYEVATKVPKRKAPQSHAWITKGGNLTFDFPKQEKLPGLRDVTTPAQEARDVGGEAPAARGA